MNYITIDKGDIITVIEKIYIDYPGGQYRDHFVDKKRYYVALEMESNNGNFKAKDKRGHIKHFNHITSNIINIIQRAEA